jgi:hypothetical protein
MCPGLAALSPIASQALEDLRLFPAVRQFRARLACAMSGWLRSSTRFFVGLSALRGAGRVELARACQFPSGTDLGSLHRGHTRIRRLRTRAGLGVFLPAHACSPLELAVTPPICALDARRGWQPASGSHPYPFAPHPRGSAITRVSNGHSSLSLPVRAAAAEEADRSRAEESTRRTTDWLDFLRGRRQPGMRGRI